MIAHGKRSHPLRGIEFIARLMRKIFPLGLTLVLVRALQRN